MNDSSLFYNDNLVVIQPSLLSFDDAILMNSEAGAVDCLGRTHMTGDNIAEPVSKHLMEMILR